MRVPRLSWSDTVIYDDDVIWGIQPAPFESRRNSVFSQEVGILATETRFFTDSTMPAAPPKFLLFSEAKAENDAMPEWRFVLESESGVERMVAADHEPDVEGERLELLAVVRGLEALDRPSHVTLMTKSRYVRRGISLGLGEWRENGWRWESFGRRVPVRNADLWRRIDRALDFHRVECRTRRLQAAC